MRLLLDTSTFLWIVLNAPELSERARQLFAEPDNEVYLSSVSAWEIAIKHALGRLPLPEPPERFLPAQRRAHGIEPLPLDEQSTFQLSRLPALHNDPFDRMLICQAIVAGMTILSSDELVSQYPVRVVW